MDLRDGKLQPRGRQFSESARDGESGVSPGNQTSSSSPALTSKGANMASGNNGRKAKKKWLVVAVVVLVLLAGGCYGWRTMGSNDQKAVKTAQFQAVFLTNGQVYFGKLTHVDNNYITLSNIFYLQVQQPVQPASTSKTDSSQVSLAKLGSELHGPEDNMFIARDQVLFWENLKNNGKVVQAIDTYQKQ